MKEEYLKAAKAVLRNIVTLPPNKVMKSKKDYNRKRDKAVTCDGR